MTTDPTLLTELEALAPTTDAMERMRDRLTADLSVDVQVEQVARTRRRRPRLAIGVVLAGAAAIAVGVALSPFDRGAARHSVVPSPTSAAAALQEAASAAGSVTWSPLGPHEYHHTMITTVTPTIPVTHGDDPKKMAQLLSLGNPMSTESWLDRDGRGLTLRASGGGGNPDEYPQVDASGFGSSRTYPFARPNAPKVDVRASLRYADDVNATAWRRGESQPTSSTWYRTRSGYERPPRRTADSFRVPSSFSDDLQYRQWGATAAQVDAVNESDDRTAAIEDLLDTRTPFDTSPTLGPVGSYGTTAETNREDARIVRAVKLLGSAPLSPAVRQDLFDWLARRPIATLEGSATDDLGRRGTRVTFERVWDETVPAHVVTIDELRAEASSVPGATTGDVSGPKSIRIKDDHQYRRWYASIIVDRASGELLQFTMYGRIETTAQHPRIQQNTIRPKDGRPMTALRVAMGVDRQGLFDEQLYGIREDTPTITKPLTAACAVSPVMCR